MDIRGKKEHSYKNSPNCNNSVKILAAVDILTAKKQTPTTIPSKKTRTIR